MPLCVAVDTDFVLAVARGIDSALESVDIVSSRLHGYLVVPPCVLQELEDMVENDPDSDTRHFADMALSQLDSWCFLCPPIDSIGLGVADINARRLMGENLSQEYQASCVIAEASTLKARLLLSYSIYIKPEDAVRLKFALIAADLTDTFVVDPRILVMIFQDPPPPLPPSGAAIAPAGA